MPSVVSGFMLEPNKRKKEKRKCLFTLLPVSTGESLSGAHPRKSTLLILATGLKRLCAKLVFVEPFILSIS